MAGVALWLALGAKRAMRCVRCGDAFCRRCKVGVDSPDYCTQCQHMITARDGLAPAIRKQKGLQTERFRARQLKLSRFSSLLWPGLGRMIDGRTVTGVLVCSAWCAACLGLLLRPRLLQMPSAGTAHPLFLVTVLLGVVAVAAWLAGNVRAAGRSRAAVGGWRWR